MTLLEHIAAQTALRDTASAARNVAQADVEKYEARIAALQALLPLETELKIASLAARIASIVGGA